MHDENFRTVSVSDTATRDRENHIIKNQEKINDNGIKGNKKMFQLAHGFNMHICCVITWNRLSKPSTGMDFPIIFCLLFQFFLLSNFNQMHSHQRKILTESKTILVSIRLYYILLLSW